MSLRPYGRRDHTRFGLAIVAVALGVEIVMAQRGWAAPTYTADDTIEAIHLASMDTGVSLGTLTRIVRCETGGTFNPAAEGDHGHSHGAAQLNDYGNALPAFFKAGYDDPYDPYQAMYFMAEALRGDYPPLGRHTWSC